MGLLSKIFKPIGKVFKVVFKPIGKLLKKWLVPKMDQQTKDGFDIQKFGANNAIPIVYGPGYVAGTIVDLNVSDSPGGVQNENLHILVVFCVGPVDVVELFLDGVSISNPRYANKAQAVIRYGQIDQSFILEAGGNFERFSTTNSTFPGLVYAYIKLIQDSEQQTFNGIPEITAWVSGRKVANIPGRSDPFWWLNPAVCLYDYLTDPIWGAGLSSSDIDLNSFGYVANKCDQLVPVTYRKFECSVSDGIYTCTETPEIISANKPRHTISTVIDTSRALFDNMQQIANVFRGFWPDSDGRVKIGVEQEGSPVFWFNESNVLRGTMTMNQPDVSERYNRVTVRYQDTREVTKPFEREVSYPPPGDAQYTTWLAEDNNVPHELTIDADGIGNPWEALQLAIVAARTSRANTQFEFDAQPEATECDVGDIVALSWTDYGFVNKTLRISDITYNPDGTVRIQAIQHENAAYPWTSLNFDDINGGTFLGDPTDIPVPTGLAIAPDQTLATRGTLTWNYEKNAFVRQYLVVITSGTTEIARAETIAKSFVIPQLNTGTYTIQVRAISTIGFASAPASIAFVLSTPIPPTSITVNASNFELTAIPVLAGIGLGTTFEFAIGNTTAIVGRGASMVFAGLVPGTEYTVYARTVNALGTSAWAFVIATTTADGSAIVDLIGGDIAAQVFDDVVTEVNAGLQGVVDASLVDYSTTVEVNQLITDRIDEVNDAVGEDPRINILDVLSNAMSNFETGSDLRTETKERITVTTQIQAQVNQNAAAITNTNQVVATLTSSTATSINTLTAATNSNAAGLTSLQQTVADLESATASDITELQSQVSDNAAGLIIANQTIADLDSATATSIASLNAAVGTNTASISSVSSALATETSTRTSQVNTLTASVNNNAAAINSTNTALATETSTRTSQINTLTASVNNNAASISSVNSALATETSTRTSQVNALTASVNGNTASINTVSAALSTETSTRASQVAQLQTDDAAIIAMVNEVESDTAGNATAISGLQSVVNNPTTGLSATYTLASQAKTTADGAATSATNVTNAVNNPTTGLAATNTLAAQAKTTADNAATSATSITNVVNNPTTGLAATNTLATQAKNTADGAATAASAVTGTVNNPTTGLSATYSIANQAKATADDALTSATSITNTVNNPTTGLAATATIANGAATTANGATTAVNGLKTAIAGAGNEANAALILETTFDPSQGFAFGRAFLGVSSTASGVTRVTGVVADGATNTLEFRADTLRLSDTAGNVQLYWDTGRNKWIYAGDIVAATFQTATSGFRAEMSGAGSLPLWYGSGEKTWANANFAVDTSGNVKLNNVTASNFSATGGIVTGSGEAVRTEIVNDGTYLIWIGSGTKTDLNGLFWIKTNGTGFIKGDFFQGQIIETKYGSSTATTGALTALASAHSSAGNPIEVTGAGSSHARTTGGNYSSSGPFQAVGTAYRNGVSIGSMTIQVVGIYNVDLNWTEWFLVYPISVIDTPGAGVYNYTYDIIFTPPSLPNLTYIKRSVTVKTFENKLG